MSIRKGDNVIAGASVGFIGKPDWSAKQQITSVPFTAPKDGIIIGACAADGTGSDHVDYYLNGAIIGTSHHVQNNYCASANMTIPVKTGDVFSAAEWYLPLSPLWFVPFEYSGVSDINVITPEYIRNVNTPDYAHQKTIAASPWTADEDVFIVYATYGSASVPNRNLYIDGVRVSVEDVENSISTTTFTGRVAKGSVISCVRITNQNVFKAFPYKA